MTVVRLWPVDLGDLPNWIAAIPFADWPQQRPLGDGQLRPAMVTDEGWFGFGRKTDGLVAAIILHIPNCRAVQRMLSVVMPGHEIEHHQDLQPPYWLCRVHVPILTNGKARFITDDGDTNMKVGQAYRVDTTKPHAVRNDGATPRVHFMVDVWQS